MYLPYISQYFLGKYTVSTVKESGTNNFSGLASFNPIEVYGGVIQLSDLIKNIIICVPKTNESFTGLEKQEGE